MHRAKFLTVKPTGCTNFSILFLEWKSICFGQLLRQSSGVSHCTHKNVICHTGMLTACEQYHDGSWSCSQAVYKPVWHIPLLCVQWKTPVDGQRNYPKHIEFHSKNKFWDIRASSWFYYKKFITKHGHMNVKFNMRVHYVCLTFLWIRK